MAELDEPFAKVRFRDFAFVFFKPMVQMDFFRRHGLGFDDFFRFVLFRNFRNDFIGFFCVFGTVHDNAAFFRFFFELGV